MPYCPKCDMEFVEGITVCTDCGGPLYESEAAAKAAMAEERAKERARELAREKAMYEDYLKNITAEEETGEETADETDEVRRQAQSILPPEPVHVYVDKSQKYDDLKSSASAFLLVGGALLVVSVLCWAGIINIPMAPVSKLIFQGALTVMGIFSLVVFLRTTSSAKKLAPQIAEEKARTRITIDWFTDQYTAEDIDSAIGDKDSLTEEELSLKRFQIIQDWLVTGKDLPDQAYVDALSEEIYTKLFENK